MSGLDGFIQGSLLNMVVFTSFHFGFCVCAMVLTYLEIVEREDGFRIRKTETLRGGTSNSPDGRKDPQFLFPTL